MYSCGGFITSHALDLRSGDLDPLGLGNSGACRGVMLHRQRGSIDTYVPYLPITARIASTDVRMYYLQ